MPILLDIFALFPRLWVANLFQVQFSKLETVVKHVHLLANSFVLNLHDVPCQKFGCQHNMMTIEHFRCQYLIVDSMLLSMRSSTFNVIGLVWQVAVTFKLIVSIQSLDINFHFCS